MSVDLDSLRAHVERLRWVRERKAELKELEESAREAIEDALGADDEGTLDGHPVVAWRFHKRTALDQGVLRTAFPDIYDTCVRTTEVRRFSLVDPE